MLSETMRKKKSAEETELYTDFEIEYGSPDQWIEEIVDEFDQKWHDIQEKYNHA